MLKLIKTFLLIVTILAVSALSSAEELTLVTLESPPLEFEKDGNATGVNVEVVLEGLKRMGHTAQVKFVPWNRALRLVEIGQADAIIDAGYNNERAAYLHYPEEHIYTEEIFAFKNSDSAVTLDKDLTNAGTLIVGVGRGYFYGDLVDDALKANRFKAVDEVGDTRLNIQKLVSGRVDLFFGVKLPIMYLVKTMGHKGDIDLVNMTGTDAPYLLGSSKTYLAFSKAVQSQETAKIFSQVLKEMKSDGTVERIHNKYQ